MDWTSSLNNFLILSIHHSNLLGCVFYRQKQFNCVSYKNYSIIIFYIKDRFHLEFLNIFCIIHSLNNKLNFEKSLIFKSIYWKPRVCNYVDSSSLPLFRRLFLYYFLCLLFWKLKILKTSNLAFDSFLSSFHFFLNGKSIKRWSAKQLFHFFVIKKILVWKKLQLAKLRLGGHWRFHFTVKCKSYFKHFTTLRIV